MSKQLLIVVGVVCLIVGFLSYYTGHEKVMRAGYYYTDQREEGQTYEILGGVIAIVGLGTIAWGATKKQESKPTKSN